MTKGLSRW